MSTSCNIANDFKLSFRLVNREKTTFLTLTKIEKFSYALFQNHALWYIYISVMSVMYLKVGCAINREGTYCDMVRHNYDYYLSQYLTNLMHKILFYNRFYFMPLHVSSTCAHHHEVKIALLSLWYHHTCR